jgi:hypothetical protein
MKISDNLLSFLKSVKKVNFQKSLWEKLPAGFQKIKGAFNLSKMNGTEKRRLTTGVFTRSKVNLLSSLE